VVYCVVVLLVAMEWTAAITGDRMGLFLGFSLRRKNLGQPFSKAETDLPYNEYL
jgi:hypothetical protein